VPSLGAARGKVRSAACASNLRQLATAMHGYTTDYFDWLPGSPHTSGNGAYFGSERELEDGSEEKYQWLPNNDAWPAVHAYDWASPLLLQLGMRPPEDIIERYELGRTGVFCCPANVGRMIRTNVKRLCGLDKQTQACSYATSKWFTYVKTRFKTMANANGKHHIGGTYWVRNQMPTDYIPTLARVRKLDRKIFLADAHRSNRSPSNPDNAGKEVDNGDLGYTTHGAWALAKRDTPSLSYRWDPARKWAFRHDKGVNAAFFDGHVEHLPEGDSSARDGYGTGARTAEFWYPTGLDTAELSGLANEPIVVP